MDLIKNYREDRSVNSENMDSDLGGRRCGGHVCRADLFPR